MLMTNSCPTVSTSPPIDPHSVGESRLEAYLARGYAAIDGWLHEPALQLTLAIARIQSTLLPPSAVGEIGVWQGRYLSLLSFISSEPRPVIGVDMFTHVPDPDLQISRLYCNINDWFNHPKQVRILQKNSKYLTPQELIAAGEGKYQFFSVDGDHTAPGCLFDLRLAAEVVAPGGVVAVDDIFNPTCPGVIEAVMRYSLAEGEAALAPFAIVGNKLFMTQRDYCNHFRQALLTECLAGKLAGSSRPILDFRAQMEALQIPVRLLGQEVLVHP